MLATSIRTSAAVSRLSSEGAFETLARARELEAQGKHIIHLEVGEPDFDTPEHVKRAGIEALDRYGAQRRTAAIDHVQANSIRNKRQLEEKDPDVRRRNFEHLQHVAATPELARDFLLNSSMIASVRRP